MSKEAGSFPPDQGDQQYGQIHRSGWASVNNEGVMSMSGPVNVSHSAIGRGAIYNDNRRQEFAKEIANLIQVAESHPDACEALEWIGKNSGLRDEPAEARAYIGSIKAAGSWLFDRFTSVVDAAAAGVAPWLVTLVHNIARW